MTTVRLHYLGIIKNGAEPFHELCAEKDLSSYSRWTKDSYAQFMSFSAKTVAGRTKPGQAHAVREKTYLIHARGGKEGICGIAITDDQYQKTSAQALLLSTMDEFLEGHPMSMWEKEDPTIDWPRLKTKLSEGQDPKQADAMAKLQSELDETKIILHETIQSIMERGEKIDNLVEKSNDLSQQSKMFFKQAKKTNSCCILM